VTDDATAPVREDVIEPIDPSPRFGAWIRSELTHLVQDGLVRPRRVVRGLPHGECELDGRRVISFATNDYLDLAGDARVLEAAVRALREYGSGARSSPLIVGRSPWHAELEARLAQFEGAEAALLFPTGYAANVGTITALVHRGDCVYCDRLNHASLIDGCRLSGAKLRVYPHGDVDRLRRLLARDKDTPRRLIVTDGLFSMDGDLAPLVALGELARQSGAWLLVDEAHGTGVYGARGRGACEACGLEGPELIRVGTLSKAIGGLGGFVAGTRELIDLLWHQARTQMFSTALPPSVCGAARQAVDLIESEPERRLRLRDSAHWFRQRLTGHGLSALGEPDSPIVPIPVGEASAAVQLTEALLSRGLLVPAIRPPTVPRGGARLRISLSCAHPASSFERLADTLAELMHGKSEDPQCGGDDSSGQQA
jgi:8-amino-7-oxononanoate synthase